MSMWNARNDLFKGVSSSSIRERDREQNDALLYEQQNDSRLDDLSSKIAALKQVTIDIHTDASSHSIIDNANNAYDLFKSGLSNTSNRLSRMTSVRHQRLACYVALGLVGLFFLLYVFARHGRSSTIQPLPDDPDSEMIL